MTSELFDDLARRFAFPATQPGQRAFLKTTTETIDQALPNSRSAILEGQGHIAMYTSPELFLQNVLTFLIKG